MDDVFAVEVQDALQDLPHVLHAVGLRVLEMIVHNALEQLAAGNAGTQTRAQVRIGQEANETKAPLHWQHSLLHDQGDLRAGVERPQTLHQLRVVQLIHQLNLLSSRVFVLGHYGTVELSGTHAARVLMGQPEHLAELPSAERIYRLRGYRFKPAFRASQLLH